MIIANQWYNIAKTGSVGSKTSVRIELGTYYALIAVSVDYGNAVISAIESNATDNKITIAARIRYNNGWMVDVKVTPGMADAELQTSLYDNSGWISVPAITSTPGSTVCIINDISSAIQFPQAGGESLFERINVGTEDKPVYAVVPKRYNNTSVGIVSETFITFGGLKGANGNNGNQGAGLTKINVVINDISYTSDGNTVTVTEKLAKQSDLQTLTSKVSELEKKVSEFSSLWTYDKVNDAVRTTFNVIIEKALTFGIGDGDISGEGGSGPGVTSLYALPEIGINKSSLSDGQVMTYDKASGLWVNKLPSIGLDEVKLAQYLTANSYLDKKSADGLYTTLTAFNALDTKVNDFLAGTDTDEIINKWKELEAFLAGQTETSTLAELLFVKADKTALEATNKALEDYRSKTDARLDSLEKMWFFDKDHADTIRTVYNIAVEKAITFGGYGESDNTGGGITSVTKEMVIGALGYTPYDSANPKGYITNAALSGYATQSWVQQQGFLTKHQDISHLLSKTEAATTYATITVLGELQSSHNALKAEFDALSTLINVDATEYIDTWNEVRDFLDGYSDSSDLASILSGINADIAKRALQTDLNSAVTRIGTLESTLEAEQSYIDILQGYFTSGKANKAIADGNGNNIVNTYATKGTTLSHYGITDAYTKTQVDNKLVNYLTTNTAQTVLASGAKIFKGAYGENIYIGGTKSGVTIDINAASGGYARTLSFINSASDASGYVLFGAYGNSASGFQSAYIGVGEQDYNNAILNIYTDRIAVAGAASFSGLTTHSAGLKIGTTNVTEKTQNSTKYVEIDGNLVVTGAISFGGFGESSGSGGGITQVTKDMVIDALGYTPYNATNPNGYITASAIPTSLKNPYGLTIYNNAGAAQVSYDGSAIKSLTLTKAMVGLGNVENTAVYTRYLGVNGASWTFASTYYTTDGASTDIYAPTSAGTAGQYLVSNGAGAPYWYSVTPYDANKSRTANTVLAAPNGSAGSAIFRKLVAADIPSLDWSKITSGKPTTISGYGITDAYTKTELDARFFGLNALGIDASGVTSLNQGGYGYAAKGWWGSGPAIAFGSTNGYTALIQQGSNTPTLYVSYKSAGGAIQNWKTIAFTDSNITGNAATATALKTTRTLWGQNFNGTDNVSGSITSSYFALSDNSVNPYLKLSVSTEYNGYIQMVSTGVMSFGSTYSKSLQVNQSGDTTINGNLVTTGSITFGSASDRRLKDNIKSMTDKQAVAVLSALNPVTFSWNSTAYELGGLSGKSDGFIADEFEKVIPNSGRDIWNNYRAIDHKRVIAYVVKGWQADHKRSDNHSDDITWLKKKVNELENELNRYRRA